jgi:hypothetical protein
MVDRRRLELRFSVCKTDVFPLDEQPMAGVVRIELTLAVLEAARAPCLSPLRRPVRESNSPTP